MCAAYPDPVSPTDDESLAGYSPESGTGSWQGQARNDLSSSPFVFVLSFWLTVWVERQGNKYVTNNHINITRLSLYFWIQSLYCSICNFFIPIQYRFNLQACSSYIP
jgi:hypothetical protein